MYLFLLIFLSTTHCFCGNTFSKPEKPPELILTVYQPYEALIEEQPNNCINLKVGDFYDDGHTYPRKFSVDKQEIFI